jgi:oligosaccharide repeat unit polymerase
MHPAVIFTGVFTLYVFVCCLGQSTYQITIAPITAGIIILGVLIFSAVTVLFYKKHRNSIQQQYEIKPIHTHLIWEIILILIQLITLYFFYRYLVSLSFAYDGKARSMGEMIKLFDTLTKFWTVKFAQMNVKVPLLYRIGNPISAAGAWLIIYISVNNFITTKKIKLTEVIIILLLVIQIVVNGSRSPLFRIVTMVIFLAYFRKFRNSKRKRGSIKTFVKYIAFICIFGIAMIAILQLMGRWGQNNKVLSEIFIYAGAPIVNLNTYLTTGKEIGVSTLFGAQTFRGLYQYLGKWFKVSSFSFPGISGPESFAFSSNGIEIGNVYTMYKYYIYDFGYWGVFPLTALMAIYYIRVFDRLKYHARKSVKEVIDLRLFFYAYLFNDLIMSAFSSRFYETIFDAPFIKLLLFVWLIDAVVYEHSLKFGSFKLMLCE